VEARPGSGQAGGHADADGLVLVLFAYGRCCCGLGVEYDSVVQACCGDVGDGGPDCRGIVGDGLRLQVDVASRPPLAEGREQDASLEHELLR
jgi:hypothetical protein